MVLVTFVTAAIAALSVAIVPSCTLDPSGAIPADQLGAGGAGQACEENADCPGLFTECQYPNCVNGTCGTFYHPAGTTCTEDEGQVCDGAGDCVECVDATQCSGDFLCQDNMCVPAYCGDEVLNGDETDLDCGGSCAPCENNKFCGVADDCQSGFCSPNGTCQPCSGHGDCDPVGEYCCLDPIVGCDPGVCEDKEDPGSECDDPVECVTGNCPPRDRVCCDSPCVGSCYSCLDGYTSDDYGIGQCGPVLDQDDPYNDCPQQQQSTCQADGTGCNGAGACRLWPSGTVCDPQHCSGGDTQNYDDTCDGGGICVNGGIDDCSPYICEGTTCRGNCVNDTHCLSGSWCNNGTCESQGNIGDPCQGDNECQSGECVDNRCCENSCGGECMACSASKTGQSNGQCRSIDPNINDDPDNECTNGACYRIDLNNGECRLDQGQVCNSNSDCLNNRCRDNRCCNTDCGGECVACRADWSVGANGICSAIDPLNDPDPNDECTGGECFVLSATVGECRLYQGQLCAVGNDCLNGICVDNRCCNNICNGECVACRADWTVGANGVCSAIDNGTDPDNDECTNGVCYELSATSGECRLSQGYWCTSNSDCYNGRCRDNYCCNSDCSGDCRSCNSAHTGGTNGICSNALSADPQGDCDWSDPSTCGETGDCGSGSCELWSGTVCGSASCSSGTEYYPDTCDGSGNCNVPGGSSSCGLYVCGATACLTSCGGDGDCVASAYCAGTTCTDKKSDGDSCSSGNECESGFCADNYCCDDACDVGCVSCRADRTAGANGECLGINVAGIDPNDYCAGGDCCDESNPGSCGTGGGC